MNRTELEQRIRRAYARIAAAERPEVWISLRPLEDVLAEAVTIDHRAPLAGTLVAVKDNIDVAGLPTTAAAPSYAHEPERDATAVARLRAGGALVLGKTNMDQFATGLVGTRSPYGAVRHAFAPERVSGGSSSGSAVAVALGFVDVALGTDTAGSGRVPAALHGLVGVKPTRGLIPTTGVVPACRSLDCVTVFARDLDTARRVAEHLAGPDGRDPSARPDAPLPAPAARPRIAVPAPEHLEGLADGWAEAFTRYVETVRATGAQVVEVDIAPLLEAAELLYGGAFVAERTAAVGAHIAEHAHLVGTDLDPTVAGIVRAGHDVTAVEVFRDRERLDHLGARAGELLAGTTALLTPTTTWHPTLADVAADPVGANSRMGRFTNFANLLDMASLAVPAGTVAGLPFGVMLTGPAFSDRTLAALAARWANPAVDLFVVGAHLSGQPLNHQLVAAGATLLGPAATAPQYRLFTLDTAPPKPGMVRDPRGARIEGEVWRLPASGFGTFVAALPQPMSIGAVTLEDERVVRGFLAEPVALRQAQEITASGSWPAAQAAAQAAVRTRAHRVAVAGSLP
ncbi:allophanate hydrolase [Kineococcus sp. SYSU DK005]|uniref:allophanate hydrolase n=1 Tax=Kineococcus sp. SYSU DK005 TaxID=3383126 RepID=UPI003D7D53A7